MNEEEKENAQNLKEELLRGLVVRPKLSSYDLPPSPPLYIQRFTSRTADEIWNQAQEPLPGLKAYQSRQKSQQEKRKITAYSGLGPSSAYQQTTPKFLGEKETENFVFDKKNFLLEGLKPIFEVEPSTILQMIRDCPELGFLYIARCQPVESVLYNPYLFNVCRFEDVDEDNYTTISRNGLLETIRGETEFLTLDEWETDYLRYKKLVRMTSFCKFRKWKGFHTWHNNIRRAKFLECRELVNRKLTYGSSVDDAEYAA